MTTEVILRKTWALVVKQWQYIALVSLISFGVSIILTLLATGSVAGGLGGLAAGSMSSDFPFASLLSGAGLASLGIGAILSLLVLPWLTGASAHIGKQVVTGETTQVWQPFSNALRHYVTYLLLTIVLGIGLGIGFMLLVIPGIILGVLLGLSPTIVAFEGVGVNEALAKAWTLGLRHFWTILLVGVIVAAAAFILGLLLGWVPILGGYVATVAATIGTVALAVLYTESK